MSEAILSANLTKFAGPVRQGSASSFIGQIGKLAPVRPVEASASKPASAKLIVPRNVVAEGSLLARKLLPLAPDKLAPANKRMVDGSPQGFPAQCRINAIKLCDEIAG